MRALTLLCIGIMTLAMATADEPKKTAGDLIAADSRLDAKVTCALPLASLEEVVAQLASASGVKLYVRDNIRDDEVILYCKDRPVRDVMMALAEVWAYQWTLATPKKDQPAGYTLIMPTSTQRRRDHLLQQLDDAIDRELLADLHRRDGFIAGDPNKLTQFIKAIDRSAWRLQVEQDTSSGAREAHRRLVAESARAAYEKVYGKPIPDSETEILASGLAESSDPKAPHATVGENALASLVASLDAATLKALLGGQPIEVAIPSRAGYTQAPSYLQAALQDAYGKPERHVYTDEEIQARADNYEDPDPADREARIQEYVKENEDAKRIEAQRPAPIVIRLSVERNSPDNKEISAAYWRGRQVIPKRVSFASGYFDSKTILDFTPGLIEPLGEDLAKQRVTIELPQIDDRAVRQANTRREYRATLRQIAEQTGRDVIAQPLADRDQPECRFGDQATVYDVLAELASAYRQSLRSENGWVMAREPLAYVSRLSMPPMRSLRKWQASEARCGVITAEDFLDIASLTEWQYEELVDDWTGDAGYLRSPGQSSPDYECAHILGGLSDSLRKRLLKGEKIKASDVSEEKRARFYEVIGGMLERGDEQEPPPSAIYVSFSQQIPYEVTYQDPVTGRQWTEEDSYDDDGHSSDTLNERIKDSCESEGRHVVSVKLDPAPNGYEFEFGYESANGVSCATSQSLPLDAVEKDEPASPTVEDHHDK